jgi:multiple antibiotic resistance protein
MNEFLLAFVPLFVAVDAVGVLPMFLGITGELASRQGHRIILQSVLTAGSVAVVFVVAGSRLMRLIGISVPDFMIAGGALLFAISLSDLLTIDKPQSRVDIETVGAVPIGVPLISGPAVLTTCLLLVDQYGIGPVVLAVILNILLAGVIFWFATPISRLLGGAGTGTLSKISSLLLAAIGVMMVRRGLLACGQLVG